MKVYQWSLSAAPLSEQLPIRDLLDNVAVQVGGLLYSWINLPDMVPDVVKVPPDATFLGILRELVVTDFPLVVNAEVMLPDQFSWAKAVKQSKSRLLQDDGARAISPVGFD